MLANHAKKIALASSIIQSASKLCCVEQVPRHSIISSEEYSTTLKDVWFWRKISFS